MTATHDTMTSVAQGDTPVLERLVSMNLNSQADSGLDPATYFLVRLAVVAMDTPSVSYLVTLGLAEDAGVTIEQAQGVLIALAPAIGSARVASAAGKILRAFGLAAALTEDDQA